MWICAALGDADLAPLKAFQGTLNPAARFEIAPAPVELAKEETMVYKMTLAAFIAAMALSPAYAADLCNDAHMKKMDEMVAKMTDAAKQKEATAALDQSKAAMKAGNSAECMKYMDQAHKAMGIG